MSATNERNIIVNLFGPNATVLDCGCGVGENAKRLKENGCQVIGIEAMDEAASLAKQWCSQVVVGDLENGEFTQKLKEEGKNYDGILFSHVLEHLRDPIPVVKNILALSSANTKIVVALPNVAYWKMRVELFKGNWKYADAGILDRTHLKFYTLDSAKETLENCGLKIVKTYFPQVVAGPVVTRLTRTFLRGLTSPRFYSSSFIFLCEKI